MSIFSTLITDLQKIIVSSSNDDDDDMNVRVSTTGRTTSKDQDGATTTTTDNTSEQQQEQEDNDDNEKTSKNNKKTNFNISHCVDILQLLRDELMIDGSNDNSKSNQNDIKDETATNNNDKKRKSKDESKSDTDEIMNKKRIQKISVDNDNVITIETIVHYINIFDKTQRAIRVMKRTQQQQQQQQDDNNNSNSNNIASTNIRTVFDTALQYTKQIGRTLVAMEQYLQMEQKELSLSSLSTNKRKRQYPLQPVEDDVHEDSKKSATKTDDIIDDEDDLDTKKRRIPNGDKKKISSVSTTSTNDEKIDIPKNVNEYCIRLKKHSKELYKDPPVLPPTNVTIDDEYMNIPKRNKKTNALQFEPSTKQKQCKDNKIIQEYFSKFTPNTTPEEILRCGSFGGTYYRPIHSAVTNIYYNNTNTVLQNSINMEWISGIDCKKFVTNPTYNQSINKYKVKCGGSLGMWESSGWISSIDPYGWFQWYCRFYNGRRSSDDVRQIQRWIAVAKPGSGRFVSQLCNKILVACPKQSQLNNLSISPVIRQTLFHWGIIITSDILNEHIQCKNNKLFKKK